MVNTVSNAIKFLLFIRTEDGRKRVDEIATEHNIKTITGMELECQVFELMNEHELDGIDLNV